MAIGPIWTRVLYHNLNPQVFALAWVVVFSCAFIAVALCVPSAALFLSTIKWCCGHNRKLLPGDINYVGLECNEPGDPSGDVEPGKTHPSVSSGPSLSKAMTAGNRNSSISPTNDKPPAIPEPEQQKTRFSNWFSWSGPSSSTYGRRTSPRSDAMEQWDRLQQQYIHAQAQSLAHVRSSFSNSHNTHSRSLSAGSLARYKHFPGNAQQQQYYDRARNGSGSFGSSSLTMNDMRDAAVSRHGRSGTQDSSTTMLLPPSPSPPNQGTWAAASTKKNRPVPIMLQTQPTPNTTFVFPGHHRSSSLARLAAWQQQQLSNQQLLVSLQTQQRPGATYPTQPVHRRYYGSDGSIREIVDVKGKGRKRSGSSSPTGGSSLVADRRLGGQVIPSGNNMIYWTSLGAKYAPEERGRKGSTGSGGMGNKI
jgi:hypothetical protein